MFLINADRGEVQKETAEIFFRKVKFWNDDGQGEAPPVFVGIILPKNDNSSVSSERKSFMLWL